MEQNVTADDVHTQSDEGQSYVGFEVNRIAQRRVFEDNLGSLINPQTPT